MPPQKQAAAKKAAAKKATAKKATAKKATAKKATAKKASAKKASAKKATAKKATAKKATAKKATAKKATAIAFPPDLPRSMRPRFRRELEEVQQGEAKQRDRFQRMLRPHTPGAVTDEKRDYLVEQAISGRPLQLIVLAVDIRKSTFVMKEVVEFAGFASTLGEFVTATRKILGPRSGMWDKFTGDGFLAYWCYQFDDEDSAQQATQYALDSCVRIFRHFEQQTVPRLRTFARNFPAGVGLSIGLDAGPAYLVELAGDLTIVGTPVVGAVRMVSAAAPWELIVNNYLGEWLLRDAGQFEAIERVTREHRATKEYDSQEVYLIDLHGFTPTDPCAPPQAHSTPAR